MEDVINQNGYGKIEIDNTEKDIVQIWYTEQQDSNVVQVRRENLQELISLLEKCKS